MIKFKKKIKSSNRLKLKKSQKIYMIMGFCISLISSFALFLNAQNANQRQQVWITSTAIAAGEVIDEKNVKLIQVDLGEVSSNYLDETANMFGQSSLQPLSQGTLLKPEHIGIKSNLRNVALRISNGHLPPSLKMNDFIDVWFSDPGC